MSHYQLSLYADKLKRNFLGGRPTPYAIVILDDGTTELGRTEVSEPTSSPDWCTSMKLDFNSQEKFTFKVQIYDYFGEGKEDRKLAEAEFEANEVYAAPGHMMMKPCISGGP
jgi:C2 domain